MRMFSLVLAAGMAMAVGSATAMPAAISGMSGLKAPTEGAIVEIKAKKKPSAQRAPTTQSRTTQPAPTRPQTPSEPMSSY